MLTNKPDPRPADAAAVRAGVALVARVTDADLTRTTPCAGWDLAALLEHMTDQHHVFAAAAVGGPGSASSSGSVSKPMPSDSGMPESLPSSSGMAESGRSGGCTAESGRSGGGMPSSVQSSGGRLESVAAGGGVAESARSGGGRPELVAPAGGVVERYERAAEAVVAAFAAVGELEQPFMIPEFGRPVPGRMAIGFHLVDYVVHAWDVARTLGMPYTPGSGELAMALAVSRAVPNGPERLAAGSPFAPALPVPPGADPMTEILLLLGRDPEARPR
ncbi:TIGR03086 family protein [Actinoplanes sp. LDG1-06]|uniref:TIGR03086 family protein n=1 Tax=Paractinoplanes ovalisporus TaxID=2810368 RepID=A0ABS2AN09_9ACTN|nr:TIGR03086 family metal-binding protein [Actinoplanes ovalisporus]MBM2620616.1 TIGR03086 family protein [Actinoplanes ovalisporus]